MNNDEKGTMFEPKYRIAVYSVIGLVGIIIVLIPILREAEDWGALVLNLGTELIGGALIFFVLHFFFTNRKTPESTEHSDIYKDLIVSTLEEAGIVEKNEIKYAISLRNLQKRKPFSYDQQDLEVLMMKYTDHMEKERRVGIFEPTKLRCFVNFMNLVAYPEDLRVITEVFTCHIIDTIAKSEKPIEFNKIAAPKVGNPALALMVAIQLEKPCIFIDVASSPFSNDTNAVNGTIAHNDKIIMVQDVVASGHLIVRCANELKKNHIAVEHVFVLIERSDRKEDGKKIPSELLRENSITLHPMYSLDDHYLFKILNATTRSDEN
jgi:orotate phosphoribosyltransferase